MPQPSERYLIPMDQFQDIIGEIGDLSDLFFEEYHEAHNIDESLKSTIVAYINGIEKDVISAMEQAYKAGSWYRETNKFHGYCTDMKYAICHVVNEPKFKWYFGEFKEAALALKSEAVQTAYEAVTYRNHQQTEKKRRDCAKAGRSSTKRWNELEAAVLKAISAGHTAPDSILRYIARHNLMGDGFWWSRDGGINQDTWHRAYKTFLNNLSSLKKHSR